MRPGTPTLSVLGDGLGGAVGTIPAAGAVISFAASSCLPWKKSGIPLAGGVGLSGMACCAFAWRLLERIRKKTTPARPISTTTTPTTTPAMTPMLGPLRSLFLSCPPDPWLLPAPLDPVSWGPPPVLLLPPDAPLFSPLVAPVGYVCVTELVTPPAVTFPWTALQ